MDDQHTSQRKATRDFTAVVAAKVERKISARRQDARGVWRGLGMMGMVGWSVVVPTLIGAGLGHLIDHRHPGGHSWTLALLVAGLTIGCANAWRWIAREDRAMHGDHDHD
jgi:ATP synthase protein I